MATTITVFPTANYSGTTTFSAHMVPQGSVQATLALDRTLWSSSLVNVSLSLQISYDGGNTFNPCGSFTSVGGSLIINGTAINASSITVTLPQAANATTQIKGSVSVTGGIAHSTGTLTLQ